MDYKKALEKTEILRVNRTMKNLEKNRMEPYFAQNKEEALEIFKTLVSLEDVITMGGAMSAEEIGAIEFLQDNNYKYIDRTGPDVTPETYMDVLRLAFTSDIFITSSNAITEKGELFNIDGNGNRVAAIAFGPKKVIVIAGINKIVRDKEEAYKRTKEIAAPANSMRLDCNTPCAVDGVCRDCLSEQRICCHELLSGFQRQAGRIKVILVNESLGF